ncbi:putative F-box protein At5g55150 [Rhodamnia argentea]|uniref:F-box protein At5g55150 n=1 Tax=Rhodamnia argentea TaxID=178133 RepID=A0A8B8N4X8_9MYRT|nr:putative F-box protein At5g55150 [Rhodamnia argentea]
MAKNWADLLPELLELCSRQLLLEDWFAFRSVCSTWRAAAFEERFNVPWLMIADDIFADDRRTNTEWAEFYSLFSSRIHKVVMPNAKEKRCLSSRGWIFTIDMGSQVHMLNPLSRAVSRYCDGIIKLPSVHEFSSWDPEDYEPETRYAKFVLSASPASSPNYMVMVTYLNSKRLGLWKPGSEEWKELTWLGDPVLDVIYYKGQFFAVDWLDEILVCDVDRPDPTAQVILKKPLEFRDHFEFCQMYLVELAGRLLLVARLAQQDGATSGFRVFAIDLEARKWTELESLENASLFVGFNSSFSVQVDENRHAIKPNCIYFTEYLPHRDTEGKEVGIYHMKDGKIEPFFDEKIYIDFSPPLWIELDAALYRSDHKFK